MVYYSWLAPEGHGHTTNRNRKVPKMKKILIVALAAGAVALTGCQKEEEKSPVAAAAEAVKAGADKAAKDVSAAADKAAKDVGKAADDAKKAADNAAKKAAN